MAQYKIKLKPTNAIIGIDIEISGGDVKAMVIAFRDEHGEAHTLEIDGTLSIYTEVKDKLMRELATVCAFLSR